VTSPTENLRDGERTAAKLDEQGVDVTLIREMLLLSPEERLQWHERTRLQALELRDAFRTSR
jgi:hypothetical protein